MRKIDSNELKQLQLKILETVADFCERNEICYWLDYGTLLGAIRHKGYIPWDDDIDLGMLRSDFERFIREFNVSGARYQVRCFENDPAFCYAYAKVLDTDTVLYEPDENGIKLSVNIDVFPYDNAPDSKRALKNWLDRAVFFYYCNILRNISSSPSGGTFRRLLVTMLRISTRPFPRTFFCKKQVENAKKYNGQKTEFVSEITCLSLKQLSRRLLDSFTKHEFEGKNYQIPSRYDEWLTVYYGDYMCLPPASQRQSHHRFVAFAKD